MSNTIVIGSRSFAAGQVDTPGEEALEFPRLVAVENLDVSGGKAKRRKGFYVIDGPTISYHNQLSFGGGHVVFDTTDGNFFDLDRYWTADIFFKATGVTGTQGLWTWDNGSNFPFEFTLVDTTLTVKAKTIGNAAKSLTHTIAGGTYYGVRLVRDNLSVYLYVNGTQVDSDTLEDVDSDTTSGLNAMYLGRDSGGSNLLAGDVSYARVFSKAYGDHALCYRHHPLPRAKHVLFCMDGRIFSLPSAATGVLDASRHQLHGQVSGSVSEATSALVGSSQVQMARHIRDGAGKRYMMVVANGEVARREII